MNFKGHILTAIFFFILFYFINNYFHLDLLSSEFIPRLFFFLIVLGASLIPDLDHKKSKGTKIMNKIIFIFILFMLMNYLFYDGYSWNFNIKNLIFFLVGATVLYFAWLGFSSFARPRHRGITHTIIALIVFTIVLFFIFNLNYAIAGFIGYFSHLVADKYIKII